MTGNIKPILLAYYGDDFTGSSDALEFLSRAGARTVLFTQPPTAGQLARYPGLDAFGVAGMTRSMAPAEMEATLRPAFERLKGSGARHVHYKICSTFDSSPEIGSIGRAIETGAAVFDSAVVPLLVAAPALGRYTAFGHLFARMGIGSDGSIYRLDRHPSMRQHPVTPATESDLRVHLSGQTTLPIGLLDILHVNQSLERTMRSFDEIRQAGARIILIDAMYEQQLEHIGALLDALAVGKEPSFSVGSSGIEMALGKRWHHQSALVPKTFPMAGAASGPLLVISGSSSVVNARQIVRALSGRFQSVALDTGAIARSGDPASGLGKVVTEVVSLMAEGKPVIVHTSLGGDDYRLDESRDIFSGKGWSQAMINQQTAKLFGTALGAVARGVAEKRPFQRMVIAGGDTSGYAAAAMGIEAVEMIAGMSPGAPLCRAYAPASPLDGVELTVKGGQVGGEDYFELVASGAT